jgi:hypothetical protein
VRLRAGLELATKATVMVRLTLLLLLLVMVACIQDNMPTTQVGLCRQVIMPCSSSSCSKCHHSLPLQPGTRPLMQLLLQQQQTRVTGSTKSSSLQQDLLACTCCSSGCRRLMRPQQQGAGLHLLRSSSSQCCALRLQQHLVVVTAVTQEQAKTPCIRQRLCRTWPCPRLLPAMLHLRLLALRQC